MKSLRQAESERKSAPRIQPRRPSSDGPDIAPAEQRSERNRLLRILTPEDYASLLPHLRRVPLNLRDVLAEADEAFRHVYFIESGVASIVNDIDGGTVEVGTVGNEGMAGLTVFLDADVSASRTFVQVAGEAKRIPAAVFAKATKERPTLRRIMNRYTQAFLVQVSQTAACNRVHKLEERCARWLLMTHDRVDGSDSFSITHQFLAFMLGVRRSGVTIAAGELQEAGLIRYTRGTVTVTDRTGLEEASCSCYGIVKEHFDRLLV